MYWSKLKHILKSQGTVLRVKLDLQVFRKFVQIQGGKNFDRGNPWRVSRIKFFFQQPELGK
jgi:hypothetical protein